MSWPSLYLATGMVCYQAVAWSLAPYRIARLLVLGIGGTILAVGWIAFRDESESLLLSGFLHLPGHLPLRQALCAMLAAVSVSAFLVASAAVESQRRGGSSEWQGVRRAIEFITDALPRRGHRFDSPGHAQFWFEWRRHGMILPLCTLGVLLLIMAPGPWLAPIRDETTQVALCWILGTPLVLAFALGKGFGKADLWSKEPALPVFLATKPLGNSGWIAAKMKAAALAALASWLAVALLTPLWLWQCCDWHPSLPEALYPPAVRHASPALLFGVLVILTWRLLIGSLFVGLSGRTWMLTTAACGVFATFIGTPLLMAILSQHPTVFRNLSWLPWFLAGLFAVRVAAAWALIDHACRRGWMTRRAIQRYLVIWFATTTFMVVAVWLLIPAEGWLKWLFVVLALFAVPLLRVACAPMALARNRSR
jgi:hypothetical protein